jgi:hypothetical protein
MIREYRGEDYDQVQNIFRQRKYEFALPDLASPLILVRKVITDTNDIPRLAAFAKLQANAYLLVDNTWKTPIERLAAIQGLQDAMIERCQFFGIDEASAQVGHRFGRRLEDKFGWKTALGKTIYREV